MRRTKMILAIIILTVPAARMAMAQLSIDKAPLSTASGVLRISYDPASELRSVIPVGIGNTFVLKQAVAELSPEAAKSEGQIARIELKQLSFVSGSTANAEFKLDSFDERVPADKLIEKVRRSLQDDLQKLDTFNRTTDERRNVLANRLESAGAELVRQKESCHVLAQLHKVPATAEIAAEQRARLDAQIETISAELEGLEARGHAIESQIAQVGKVASEAVAKDPVVAELEKSVEFRQAVVAARRAAQTTTTAEGWAAEGELAEHKAELAKFRREANQLAGGQRLVELRRRLEDTAIERAEAKAKLAALIKMRDAIGFSAQLDIKRMEVERLESGYRELAHDLDQLVHTLRIYQPPTVTLTLQR
jgi:vacuolar-type H+-ATPase subunit I/STV1